MLKAYKGYETAKLVPDILGKSLYIGRQDIFVKSYQVVF